MSGEAVFRTPDFTGLDLSMSQANGKQEILGFPRLRTASWSFSLYLGNTYSQKETAPRTKQI